MKDPRELTSLNSGLVNFDLNDVTVEELERRLELAAAVAGDGCTCPNLTSCGSYCNGKDGA